MRFSIDYYIKIVEFPKKCPNHLIKDTNIRLAFMLFSHHHYAQFFSVNALNSPGLRASSSFNPPIERRFNAVTGLPQDASIRFT